MPPQAGSPFTTPLSPDEEAQFQAWAQQNKLPDVDHPDSHYDYRGFWKETKGAPHLPGSQMHFPDTYKQPGHPTFSVESKYAAGRTDAGRWDGDKFIPPSRIATMPGEPQQGQPASWDDYIQYEAKQQGVSPMLALAVARKESGQQLNPNAVGDGGQAVGMFQLHPAAAKDTGTANRADPIQNVKGGVTYLAQLNKRYNGDVNKVLQAYNGGMDNVDKGTVSPAAQAYAAEVIANLSQGMRAGAAPKGGRVSGAGPAGGSPGGRMSGAGPGPTEAIKAAGAAGNGGLPTPDFSGYDPRTPEGRENDLSTLAGIGAAAVLPEAGALAYGAKLFAPSVVGAITAGTEQMLGTAPPDPGGALGAATEAAKRQAEYEIGGRMFLWPVRKLFRMGAAKTVSEAARTGIEAETATAVKHAEDLYQAERAKAPKVEDLANAVSKVTTGPAAEARRMVGRQVGKAAASGPEIDMVPVKQELTTMTRAAKPESIYPSEAPTQGIGYLSNAAQSGKSAAAATATPAERAKFSKLIQQQLGLPQEDRLPLSGILDALHKAPDQISFADAHALKQLLDERVTWDRPAKAINERLTKGIRGVLRDQMAVHPPYEAATAAYESIAPLYDPKKTGGKIIKAARADPDKLVTTLSETRPTAAKVAKRLLVDQAAAGGDPAAGMRAWDTVRSHYTYRKLLTGGAKGLADRVDKLKMEHPEFVETVFGDQPGQQILANLSQIGQAFTAAEERGAQTMGRFNASTLAEADRHLSHQAVDVAHGLIAPHSPGGMRSIARTILGSPKAADFLEWSSYSPLHTKLLVTSLLHPEASEAGAMLVRAWNSEGRYSGSDDLLDATGAAPAPKK